MNDWISDVYKTDRIAIEVEMNSKERLKLHQCFSTPIMDSLKEWLNQQIDDHSGGAPPVESNSSLGEAIRYMLNHWSELTQFI